MRLLKIANGLEADHAGRISVGAINHHAVADGWLEAHPSGAYVKLTQAGAKQGPVQGP
jgi:hypothetical protein